MKVAFWPHMPDRRVASTRIRCLQLLPALQALGINATLYNVSESPPDCLVLSKRYDATSIAHARTLRDKSGTRLILDLCDNHFHVIGHDPKLLQRCRDLSEAMRYADAIVASTPTLASYLCDKMPAEANKIVVIGDAVDEDAIRAEPRTWRSAIDLLKVQVHLQIRHQVPPGRRLIWFGNHGSDGVEGGMSDINLIAEALGQHHSQRALSLTVVSNNKDKFKRLQKAWRFPSIYVAWSPGITAELARLHDISVIPVGLNPFTSCKSPNRAVTSFLNDLAVTASPIPSYSELFAENIETDWHHGLARMMHDVALRQKTISAAKRIIEQRCAVGVIARQWHDFLLPN